MNICVDLNYELAPFPYTLVVRLLRITDGAVLNAGYTITSAGVAVPDNSNDELVPHVVFYEVDGVTGFTFDVTGFYPLALPECTLRFDTPDYSTIFSAFSTAFGGNGTGYPSVDLSSVLSAISALSSSLTNIDNNSQNILSGLGGLCNPLSSVDFSQVGNPFEMGVSLNGNGSRYKDGLEVFVSDMVGKFKVLASVHSRADANIYTVIYKLQKIENDGTFSSIHFVPEALVYLEVEKAS